MQTCSGAFSELISRAFHSLDSDDARAAAAVFRVRGVSSVLRTALFRLRHNIIAHRLNSLTLHELNPAQQILASTLKDPRSLIERILSFTSTYWQFNLVLFLYM